jgi:uncharacterized membrane protein YfcA
MERLARFLFIILVGFASGFASGAFGIGGGSITTPAIRLLLMESSGIALGTPLPIIFPSALVGGLNYYRAGKIRKDLVIVCSLNGLAGAVLGSLATGVVDTRYIMILTALFLLYLAYRTLESALRGEATPEARGKAREGTGSLAVKAGVGFAAGFFSGFMGLGGGTILVPAFLFLLHMDVKEALGNSLVVIAALAIPGMVIHTFLGHIDWLLALGMMVGVMPGSYVGSFFTLRARKRRVLLLFSMVLAAIGIIFIINEVRGLLAGAH